MEKLKKIIRAILIVLHISYLFLLFNNFILYTFYLPTGSLNDAILHALTLAFGSISIFALALPLLPALFIILGNRNRKLYTIGVIVPYILNVFAPIASSVYYNNNAYIEFAFLGIIYVIIAFMAAPSKEY